MKKLQIGYSRVNITPSYPVGMAGGAATRISEGYLDPLYITFIRRVDLHQLTRRVP